MGDRGNIAIKQSDGDQVWFYGHWYGSGLGKTVRNALSKQWRWNDEAYLARIIWDEFCPKEDRGEEGGFGISCRMQDNEYPIIVVDCVGKIVFFIHENELENGKIPSSYTPKETWTFRDFCNLKGAE